MNETLVLVDSGFLSKVSKHLGNGRHLVYNIVSLAKNLAKKENLICKRIFYFTAPPFQSNPSNKGGDRRRKYDRFIKKLKENQIIKIEEGRVQKIKNSNGEIKYFQKGVDTLLIMRLSFAPIDFPNIKKIILISSDSDFCPVIEELKSKGIGVILFSYHEKKRNTNFSRSDHLLRSCSKYIKLSKEDFQKAPLKKS